MMVWSLFIIDLMGLFSTQNRLHNIHRGFTHYKYYRARFRYIEKKYKFTYVNALLEEMIQIF